MVIPGGQEKMYSLLGGSIIRVGSTVRVNTSVLCGNLDTFRPPQNMGISGKMSGQIQNLDGIKYS